MPRSDRTLWRTIWENAVWLQTLHWLHSEYFMLHNTIQGCLKDCSVLWNKILTDKQKSTWRWCSSVEDHYIECVTWMVMEPNHRSGGYSSSFTSEFLCSRPETITVTAASSTKGNQEQITPPTIEFITEQQNQPTWNTDLNE